MGLHLTVEQRRRVRRLRAEGMRVTDVAREIGCSLRTIKRVTAIQGKREERRTRWSPGERRLSLKEREEISLGLRRGDSLSAIARPLGRATSTVSREVKANGGREAYRAWRAHDRAYEQARRPKPAKLACPRLGRQVTEWLEQWWSPEEISRRLPIEFPDDPMMRVSHETIYQSIYVQGRGELRRELARCLRTGRAKRRPRGRVQTRGRIAGMVMISDRPAEVDDRAVPGHWEGDLLIGQEGRSAVGTLVERTTGYLLLLHLPDGKEAERVDRAMRRAVAKLPGEFFRTVTWTRARRCQGRHVHHRHRDPGLLL